MPRISILSILLLSFFLSFSQDDRKTQLWNYNSLAVHVMEQTTIEVVEKIHYSAEEGNVNLRFGDVWLKHKVNNWFELGGGFRVLQARNNMGWVKENRPMLIAVFSKNIRNTNFSFSSRLGYRSFENRPDFFSHRQKVDINFPPFSRLNLQFFTAEESFLNLENMETGLARFYAGINTLKRKHFQIKVYYSLEKNRNIHNWNTVDILGMNMNIRL